MRQTQITRVRSIKSIGEAAREWEAQQHEDQMRKARRAVKRARMISAEAERFLTS